MHRLYRYMSTADHEYHVYDGMHRLQQGIVEGSWRCDVVDQSTNRCLLSMVTCVLPHTEYRCKVGALEVAMQHLAQEVHVRYQGGL